MTDRTPTQSADSLGLNDSPESASGEGLGRVNVPSQDVGRNLAGIHPQDLPTVELTLDAKDTDPSLAGWIEPALVKIAGLAGVRGGVVSLAMVGDSAMADLHERYSGVPGTTDVLTFDLSEPAATGQARQGDELESRPGGQRPDSLTPPSMVDGDIVICLDEAARQAANHGHEIRSEALLYAVHGLLHLLGYEDHDESHSVVMHKREDELLIAAGFGPIFSCGRQSSVPRPTEG